MTYLETPFTFLETTFTYLETTFTYLETTFIIWKLNKSIVKTGENSEKQFHDNLKTRKNNFTTTLKTRVFKKKRYLIKFYI